MFHVETRRRLVRRIPAEGLDPCGYGIDVFLFATRHLIVVCTQTCIFHCCIVFKAVVCRLYAMLYPCICNVVLSCWKSGAYGYVLPPDFGQHWRWAVMKMGSKDTTQDVLLNRPRAAV